jgi:hypothetical protein
LGRLVTDFLVYPKLTGRYKDGIVLKIDL